MYQNQNQNQEAVRSYTRPGSAGIFSPFFKSKSFHQEEKKLLRVGILGGNFSDNQIRPRASLPPCPSALRETAHEPASAPKVTEAGSRQAVDIATESNAGATQPWRYTTSRSRNTEQELRVFSCSRTGRDGGDHAPPPLANPLSLGASKRAAARKRVAFACSAALRPANRGAVPVPPSSPADPVQNPHPRGPQRMPRGPSRPRGFSMPRRLPEPVILEKRCGRWHTRDGGGK